MRGYLRFLSAIAVLLLACEVAVAQVDVAKIKTRIQSELRVYYRATDFNVAVEPSGRVTVKGEVPSYWDRLRVHGIISRVQGVTSISNRILVNTDVVTDATIKANIQSNLDLNSAIMEPKKIEVTVNKGTVILDGTVSSYREALMATDIASWSKGVKNVASEIKVIPPQNAVSDENLTEMTRGVIDRKFPLQKKTVQVSVMEGKAILNGTVTNLWAKNNIPKEVRRVYGITAAENNLQVKPGR